MKHEEFMALIESTLEDNLSVRVETKPCKDRDGLGVTTEVTLYFNRKEICTTNDNFYFPDQDVVTCDDGFFQEIEDMVDPFNTSKITLCSSKFSS